MYHLSHTLACSDIAALQVEDLMNETPLSAEGLLAKWMLYNLYISHIQTRIGGVTDRFMLQINLVNSSFQIHFKRKT